MCVCVCVCVCVCNVYWVLLVYSRNWHNIVYQLYCNFFKAKKKNPRQRYMVRGREMVLGFFVCFILLFMIENDNAKKRGVPVVAQ